MSLRAKLAHAYALLRAYQRQVKALRSERMSMGLPVLLEEEELAEVEAEEEHLKQDLSIPTSEIEGATKNASSTQSLVDPSPSLHQDSTSTSEKTSDRSCFTPAISSSSKPNSIRRPPRPLPPALATFPCSPPSTNSGSGPPAPTAAASQVEVSLGHLSPPPEASAEPHSFLETKEGRETEQVPPAKVVEDNSVEIKAAEQLFSSKASPGRKRDMPPTWLVPPAPPSPFPPGPSRPTSVVPPLASAFYQPRPLTSPGFDQPSPPVTHGRSLPTSATIAVASASRQPRASLHGEGGQRTGSGELAEVVPLPSVLSPPFQCATRVSGTVNKDIMARPGSAPGVVHKKKDGEGLSCSSVKSEAWMREADTDWARRSPMTMLGRERSCWEEGGEGTDVMCQAGGFQQRERDDGEEWQQAGWASEGGKVRRQSLRRKGGRRVQVLRFDPSAGLGGAFYYDSVQSYGSLPDRHSVQGLETGCAARARGNRGGRSGSQRKGVTGLTDLGTSGEEKLVLKDGSVGGRRRKVEKCSEQQQQRFSLNSDQGGNAAGWAGEVGKAEEEEADEEEMLLEALRTGYSARSVMLCAGGRKGRKKRTTSRGPSALELAADAGVSQPDGSGSWPLGLREGSGTRVPVVLPRFQREVGDVVKNGIDFVEEDAIDVEKYPEDEGDGWFYQRDCCQADDLGNICQVGEEPQRRVVRNVKSCSAHNQHGLHSTTTQKGPLLLGRSMYDTSLLELVDRLEMELNPHFGVYHSSQ